MRSINIPVGDDPLFLGPIMLPPVQLVGAGVSLVFLACFTWFFLKTRMGVAMRAVADNQTVSMGMGINVQRYFALAWALTGVVSALGGVIWGAMLGVDNQLPLVGLKVFPVVILGGLDSIVGAVVGGLIVGVVEALAAGYLDPLVGGGTKDFAPYVLDDSDAHVPARTVCSAAAASSACEALMYLSRIRRVQDQLCSRHGTDAAAQHALGGRRAWRAVRRRHAAGRRRIHVCPSST